jgi:hypothetical protein
MEQGWYRDPHRGVPLASATSVPNTVMSVNCWVMVSLFVCKVPSFLCSFALLKEEANFFPQVYIVYLNMTLVVVV